MIELQTESNVKMDKEVVSKVLEYNNNYEEWYKKPRIQTALNYQSPPPPPMSQRIVTQPDMTMPLDVIVNRYSQGLEVPGINGLYYTEDVLLPAFGRKSDPYDVEMAVKANQERIQRLTDEANRILDARKKAEKADIEKRQEEWYNKIKAKKEAEEAELKHK